MFGYIATIVVTIFIVSIITEHMVIKRLQMSPGVEIKNGRCRLKQGFGSLVIPESPEQVPGQLKVSRNHMMNMDRTHNEIHDDWYRPFVN